MELKLARNRDRSGADGIHSAKCASLIGPDAPRFTGKGVLATARAGGRGGGQRFVGLHAVDRATRFSHGVPGASR
jgi:hypothetical protein